MTNSHLLSSRSGFSVITDSLFWPQLSHRKPLIANIPASWPKFCQTICLCLRSPPDVGLWDRWKVCRDQFIGVASTYSLQLQLQHLLLSKNFMSSEKTLTKRKQFTIQSKTDMCLYSNTKQMYTDCGQRKFHKKPPSFETLRNTCKLLLTNG